MRVSRLTLFVVLVAVVLTGCIVQADTFNDQNPFSAPDTLQSSDDGSTEPPPEPTATPTPATPEPTATPDVDDKKWNLPNPTPGYPTSGRD